MASIYKRKGSPYWWLAYYKDGRRRALSLKTRDEGYARALAAEILADAEAGRRDRVAGDYLDLAEQWEAWSKSRRAANTHSSDLGALRKFNRWRGENNRKHVTLTEADEYVAVLLDRGLANVTINNWIGLIKRLYNFGVRRRIVLENPLRHLKKLPVEDRPIDILSEAQVKSVLKAASAETPKLKAAVFIALFAGLRAGEIRRLKWGDVDFEGKRILVRKTKTRSYRYVPMPSRLAAVLLALRGAAQSPVSYTAKRYFGEALRDLLRKLEIRGDWYTLRHTYASRLAQRGVSLYKVSAWLGTKTLAVVQRHYARLAETHDADVERLDFGEEG